MDHAGLAMSFVGITAPILFGFPALAAYFGPDIPPTMVNRVFTASISLGMVDLGTAWYLLVGQVSAEGSFESLIVVIFTTAIMAALLYGYTKIMGFISQANTYKAHKKISNTGT